jgi:hypothetical protein
MEPPAEVSMRRLTLCAVLCLTIGLGAQSSAPRIENGRVELRTATAIDREIASLAAGQSDPLWVGWRVPIADGRHGGCCVYDDGAGDGQNAVRGCFVEQPATPGVRALPQIAPPTSPVPLEAGSGLVLLVRVANGHVDRLRPLGDDCPLDAGGRTVYWLQNASAADSLRFLTGLMAAPDAATRTQAQRLRASALSAIALHLEPAATGVLRDAAQRDADANVRAEAAYWLAQRGDAAMKDALGLLDTDAPDLVKRRTVQGIARLPDAAGLPVLLDLAGASRSLVVRKAAVQALGRSSDPRARTYVEGLLK